MDVQSTPTGPRTAQWSMTRRALRTVCCALLFPAASSAQAGAGDLVIRVHEFDAARPIAGVAIALDGVSLGATDSTGYLRRTGVALGRHLFALQHLGHRPLQLPATIRDDSATVLDLEMVAANADVAAGATTLGAVTVTASPVPSAPLTEFERHLARGVGQFVTRAQIDKLPGHTLVEILRARTSARFAPTYSRMVLGSIRQQPSGSLSKMSGADTMRPCFAQVYRDGVRLWSMPPNISLDRGGMTSSLEQNPPPDLREIVAQELDALEYYPDASSAPPEYRSGGAECGTLLIWSRRAP